MQRGGGGIWKETSGGYEVWEVMGDNIIADGKASRRWKR